MYVSNYIVTFIDILGQRNTFENNPKVYDGNQEEALKMIKASFSKVEYLKRIITQTLDAYQDRDNSIFTQMGWKIPNISQSRFSDCLELHSSMINQNGNEIPIVSLFGMLTASSSICLLSLVQGFSIRGGMVIGMGIENDDGSIYGPSLFEAVLLEEECAEYPRIVLNDQVLKYIGTIENLPATSEKNKVEAKIAEKCRELIVVEDGVPFVHFLTGNVMDILPPNENIVIIEQLKKYILESITQSSDNKRVRRKYEWIIEYDRRHENLLKL